MAAITICSDFGAQKMKSDTLFIPSPSTCHELMGPDAHRDIVQEAGIKTIPKKKKCKKAKWFSEEALKRREVKGKEKRKDMPT